MATYDDDVVTVDDSGITIKNFYLPGRSRHIPFDDVVDVELIQLGFGSGRHQLVGVGPLRPRLFFHWDRRRSAKSHGLSIDLGRWFRLAITPSEPKRVLSVIRSEALTQND